MAHGVIFEGGVSAERLHDSLLRGDLETAQALIAVNELLDVVDDHGRNAMHLAALHKRTRIVHSIKGRMKDINAPDKDGNTALHLSTFNKPSCAEALLQEPREETLNVNAQNNKGQTLLHLMVLSTVGTAKEHYSSNDLNFLLGSEDDHLRPDILNADGHSPLHLCIVHDVYDMFVAMCEKCPQLIRSHQTKAGESLLWLAVSYGRVKMANYLLHHRAEVDKPHPRLNATPLWLATYINHLGCIGCLLSHGAKIDVEPAIDGTTPLLLAIVRDDPQVVLRLHKESAGNTEEGHFDTIAQIVLFGQPSLLQKFVEDKQDMRLGDILMQCTEEGNNIIHIAVLSDSGLTVEATIDLCKANLKKEMLKGMIIQRNKQGVTPTELALQRGVKSVLHQFDIQDEIITQHSINRLAKLSKSFPSFSDHPRHLKESLRNANQDWFVIEVDKNDNIECSQLLKFVLPKFQINWNKVDDIREQRNDPKYLPCMQEVKYSIVGPADNVSPETRLVKAALDILSQIEFYLRNEHPFFSLLDVSLLPVGSVVEGTKVGTPNEADVVVHFRELISEVYLEFLDGDLVLRYGESLYNNIDPVQRKYFFTKERTMRLDNFFEELVRAIGRAMKKVTCPTGIYVPQYDSPCEEDECLTDADSKRASIFRIHQQCKHKLPPVCFTKVGVGLNLVSKIEEYKDLVFTVDLVPQIHAFLNNISLGQLRGKTISRLLQKKPTNWMEYIRKHLSEDRLYLGHMEVSGEAKEAFLQMKMVNFDMTEFVLRSRFQGEATNPSQFDKEECKAYTMTKVLKEMTNSKVKSFGVKKLIAARTGQNPHYLQLVKEILQDNEFAGMYDKALHPSLAEKFSCLDVDDFPKHGSYIHLVRHTVLDFHNAVDSKNNEEAMERLKSHLSATHGGNIDEFTMSGVTLLAKAVELFDLDLTQVLLQAGSDPNYPDLEGNTVLHRCILHFVSSKDGELSASYNENKEGLSKLVKILLTKGGRADILNERGFSVLHLAAYYDMRQVVEHIVKAYPEVTNHANDRQENALLYAVSRGNLAMTKLLLQSNASLDRKCFVGNSILMIACEQGRTAIVKELLKHNVDVNYSRHDDEVTALHLASQEGHCQIVKDLLGSGAVWDQQRWDGGIAFKFASLVGYSPMLKTLLSHYHEKRYEDEGPLVSTVQSGHTQCVEVLAQDKSTSWMITGSKFNPVYSSSRQGDVATLKVLLEHGAPVNRCVGASNTPLMVASERGNLQVVKELVQRPGVNINAARDDDQVTALIIAADNGQLQTVKALLNAGAQPEKGPFDDMSALLTAVGRGHYAIVKVLLDHGANPNIADFQGKSALYKSCAFGRYATTKLLLAKGAKVNQGNVDGTTPLYMASQEGNVELMQLLLQHGAEVNTRTKDNGFTALFPACLCGLADAVDVLLANGAEINIAAADGSTPLFNAVGRGHTAVVRQLLEKGANINSLSPMGSTPLYIASQLGYTDMVDLFLEFGAAFDACQIESKVTPLHAASERGHLDVVKSLLRVSPEKKVNLRAFGGEVTALYLAVQGNHHLVVRELVQNGAVTDQSVEFSPLMVACNNGYYQCVKELLREGKTDVNEKSRQKLTPLYVACMKTFHDIVEILLEHGADPNIDTTNGIFPIHISSEIGNMDVISMLLRRNAKVNVSKHDGIQPLYLSVAKEHLSVVKALLTNKANPNHVARHSTSCLGRAVTAGNIAIVRALLNHGANVNHVEETGNTCLYIAAQLGYTEIVQLLLEHGGSPSEEHQHDKSTLLHVAAERGHVQVIRMLLRHSKDAKSDANKCRTDGTSPLYLACQNGHKETVRVLLLYGANVDIIGSPSMVTPLRTATTKGHLEIMQELLEAGASVDLQGGNKSTPLFVAAMEGNAKAIELLVEFGADLDIRAEGRGFTPVGIACHMQMVKATRVLVDLGANVNLKRDNGYTPLMDAVQLGDLSLVRILLTSPNLEQDTLDETVHAACTSNRPDILSCLLESGANIDVEGVETNPGGETPLISASRQCLAKVVECLVGYGAKLDSVDKGGRSAFELAVIWDHADVLVHLLEKQNLRKEQLQDLLLLAQKHDSQDIAELIKSKIE